MDNELRMQLVLICIFGICSLMVWVSYKESAPTSSERYATFGPRFWSGMVDSFVLSPVGLLTSVVLLLPASRLLAALLVIVQSLIWLVYTAQMHARYGQTVGKMATKVRVVDCRTEEQISLWQAWLREGIPVVLSLGILAYQVNMILTTNHDPRQIISGAAMQDDVAFYLLGFLPMAWYLLEIVTMLTNEKRRSLHDFIAGTVVVRTNIKLEALPQAV